MKQLSEIDTSFIFLETESSPLHIGIILLLDATDETFRLPDLTALVADRIHRSERFRQRLVMVPLKLDNPYWADDPQFSLSHHLREVKLPTPGRLSQLLKHVSDDLAEPLTRERPLWEATLLHGLSDIDRAAEAHSAVYFKIHQSLIDGSSGEELVAQLLDSESPTPDNHHPPKWTPAPLPSMAQLIGQAYGRALSLPKRWAVLAKDAAGASFYQALVEKLRQLSLPAALFNAPVAPFNRAVNSSRILDSYSCRFDQIRHLKQKAPGVSTNALLITLCSEALRAYLAHHKVELTASMTALTPVSVRSKQMNSPTGSQLTALLSYLATNEPNMAHRLFTIHRAIESSDAFPQAVGAGHLSRVKPTALLGLSARTYSEFLLAQRHKPLFNLPITNIPGPKRTFTMAGHKVIQMLGSTPLFDGLGLSITIVTYRDHAVITLTASPIAIPDLNVLTAQFERALVGLANDLEKADWQDMLSRPDDFTPKQPSLWSALLEDSQSIIQHIMTQWIGRERRKEPRGPSPQ